MYKKGSLKIKYKHLKTILQMDKVQKEQQSLEMNRSNGPYIGRMNASLPQVNKAVRTRIVQKVLQNVLHTFFFGSFSSTLVIEKIG